MSALTLEMLGYILSDNVTSLFFKSHVNSSLKETEIVYIGQKSKRTKLSLFDIAGKCKTLVKKRYGVKILSSDGYCEVKKGNRTLYSIFVSESASDSTPEYELVFQVYQWILNNTLLVENTQDSHSISKKIFIGEEFGYYVFLEPFHQLGYIYTAFEKNDPNRSISRQKTITDLLEDLKTLSVS